LPLPDALPICVGLGRAEALGEADHQDPDRGRRELEVVDGGHLGQPEGGQARLDVADDGGAGAVQGEQLDGEGAGGAAAWRSSANSWTTRMPSTTATSDPGTIGATRLSPRISASDTSPSSRVSQWVWSSWPSRCQSCSKNSPLPLGTPNSLGSCPTTIVRARPMMKPLSTGSEMKLATKPSRASPAMTPMTPVVIASVTVRAANRPLPWVARSATAAAGTPAAAAIGPTAAA